MKAPEFLKTVLSKFGVDPNSTDVQTFLGNASLASIEVSEELSKVAARDIFTRESAMQNPDIRKALRTEALNGVDAYAEELATKYGFTPEEISDLKKEDKTNKKLETLAEKLRAKTEALHKANGTGKEALQKDVEKLNADMAKLKTDHEAELSSERTARKSDKINWHLDGIYNNLDYSLPVDKKISVMSAKTLLGQFLNDKGLSFDDTDKGLVLMTKEGTQYFDPANNQPPKPEDFIKKVLLENKMLKTTPATGKGTHRTPQQRQSGTETLTAIEAFKQRNEAALNEHLQNTPPSFE